MSFTTCEFPGRVFNSLEEFKTVKHERERLRKQLQRETAAVTVEKVGIGKTADSPQ